MCLRASRIVACSAAQEALTLHFAGHDAVTSQAPCECEKLMALYVQQCQNSTQQLQHCVKSCSRGVPQLQSVAGVDVREKQQQTCEDHSAVARLRQVQQPAAGPLCSKRGGKQLSDRSCMVNLRDDAAQTAQSLFEQALSMIPELRCY